MRKDGCLAIATVIRRKNHQRVVIDSEFLELSKNRPERIVDPRFTSHMAVGIKPFSVIVLRSSAARCHDLWQTFNFPLSSDERMIHGFSPGLIRPVQQGAAKMKVKRAVLVLFNEFQSCHRRPLWVVCVE